MIIWRNKLKHLIKGLFGQSHTIASAITIKPVHEESSISLINRYGIATNSAVSASGTGTESRLTGSSANMSLINSNGLATNSIINLNGLASESSV
jgi:hypothetical protein